MEEPPPRLYRYYSDDGDALMRTEEDRRDSFGSRLRAELCPPPESGANPSEGEVRYKSRSSMLLAAERHEAVQPAAFKEERLTSSLTGHTR